MPLYDYRCKTCQKTTEVRHGFGETFDGACPSCGGEMARVFNAAGIVFKGSGFYINDSRAPAKTGKSGGAATASSEKPADAPSTPDASSAAAAPAAAAPATEGATAKKSDGPSKSDTAA